MAQCAMGRCGRPSREPGPVEKTTPISIDKNLEKRQHAHKPVRGHSAQWEIGIRWRKAGRAWEMLQSREQSLQISFAGLASWREGGMKPEQISRNVKLFALPIHTSGAHCGLLAVLLTITWKQLDDFGIF